MPATVAQSERQGHPFAWSGEINFPARDNSQALLRELIRVWNPLGTRGLFVFLNGYIDESYNQQVFTLSCLVAKGKDWLEFSRKWKLVLNAWNKRLKSQGRPLLSRYHAADCSNLKGEFAGWTPDEQRAFVVELMRIFKSHPVDTVAYSVDLDEFKRIIPESLTEAQPDFGGYIYGLTLKQMLYEITNRYGVPHPDTRLSLVYDRSSYAGIVQESFVQVTNDASCEHRNIFTTCAMTGWEHCVPLQPTDLVAYENFKDAMRKKNPRDRRKALDVLVNLDSFGGRARFMGTDAILEWRAVLLASSNYGNAGA
jgi:hypothetical protein